MTAMEIPNHDRASASADGHPRLHIVLPQKFYQSIFPVRHFGHSRNGIIACILHYRVERSLHRRSKFLHTRGQQRRFKLQRLKDHLRKLNQEHSLRYSNERALNFLIGQAASISLRSRRWGWGQNLVCHDSDFRFLRCQLHHHRHKVISFMIDGTLP